MYVDREARYQTQSFEIPSLAEDDVPQEGVVPLKVPLATTLCGQLHLGLHLHDVIAHVRGVPVRDPIPFTELQRGPYVG